MDEIITPDEHSAEIAALNHEIYELSRQLAECRESSLRQTLADPEDPFENPTITTVMDASIEVPRA